MIAEETPGISKLGIHTGFRSAVACQRKQLPRHQRQKVSMASREDSTPALGKAYGAELARHTAGVGVSEAAVKLPLRGNVVFDSQFTARGSIPTGPFRMKPSRRGILSRHSTFGLESRSSHEPLPVHVTTHTSPQSVS